MSQILIFTIAFLFSLLAWTKNGSVSLEPECGTNTSRYCPGDLINIGTNTAKRIVQPPEVGQHGSISQANNTTIINVASFTGELLQNSLVFTR